MFSGSCPPVHSPPLPLPPPHSRGVGGLSRGDDGVAAYYPEPFGFGTILIPPMPPPTWTPSPPRMVVCNYPSPLPLPHQSRTVIRALGLTGWQLIILGFGLSMTLIPPMPTPTQVPPLPRCGVLTPPPHLPLGRGNDSDYGTDGVVAYCLELCGLNAVFIPPMPVPVRAVPSTEQRPCPPPLPVSPSSASPPSPRSVLRLLFL